MTARDVYLLPLQLETYVTEQTVTHRIQVRAGGVTVVIHRHADTQDKLEIVGLCRHLLDILEGIWDGEYDENGPIVLDLRPEVDT